MPTGQAAEQAAQHSDSGDKNVPVDKGPGSVAGNLTHDPDLRYTPNGRAVSTVRVATSERVRDDRTGEWKDGPVAYYNVICWGNLAENVCDALEKGDRIVAEGRWTERSWTSKDGEPQSIVELTARDLGPSMMFRCARPVRPQRKGA